MTPEEARKQATRLHQQGATYALSLAVERLVALGLEADQIVALARQGAEALIAERKKQGGSVQ